MPFQIDYPTWVRFNQELTPAQKASYVSSGAINPFRPLEDLIIEELESLKITEGRHTGKNLEVLDWERSFIKGLVGHSIIALTIARGNGKTAFCGGLGVLGLLGVLSRPRGHVVVVASSLDQGRICFDHIVAFIGEERLETERWNDKLRFRKVNHDKKIYLEDLKTGCNLQVLGSDAKRAHGRAPHLLLGDEPAKWVDAQGGKMFAALKTSLGKHMDSKFISLGTRPERGDHWFAKLIDNPGEGEFVQAHFCIPGDDDDFSMDSIRKANPSIDHMPDLMKQLEVEMKSARMGGDDLNSWRALRLNMGTEEIQGLEKICTVEAWDAVCEGEWKKRAGPCFIGFDLGGGISMSCVAIYWPETYRLEVYGAFPDTPDLNERGKQDGVGDRYIKMEKSGDLQTFPGYATDNVKFLISVSKLLRGENIVSATADRYKKTDARQALSEAYPEDPDISETGWNVIWRPVGRGPSGSEDIRLFRRAVLTNEISSKRCLMMESAIRESVVKRDDNGNEALSKARQKGRNDALQAAVLAVGAGQRHLHPEDGSEGAHNYILADLYK